MLLENQFKNNLANAHGAPSSEHHGHGGRVLDSCGSMGEFGGFNPPPQKKSSPYLGVSL